MESRMDRGPMAGSHCTVSRQAMPGYISISSAGHAHPAAGQGASQRRIGARRAFSVRTRANGQQGGNSLDMSGPPDVDPGISAAVGIQVRPRVVG